MLKSVKNLRCAIPCILLTVFQSGCLVFTLEGPPEGRDSFVVHSLTFECHKYYYGGVAPVLTAAASRCVDGVPFKGEEVKLAIGLIPGYAKSHNRSKGDPISYSIASVITTPVALGIPLISALCYEPFMSSKSAKYEDENTFAEMSPIGCCKFKKRNEKVLALTSYQVEYNGRRYSNVELERALMHVKKGERVRIKLLSEPTVATSGERIEGMADFVGIELEAVVK